MLYRLSRPPLGPLRPARVGRGSRGCPPDLAPAALAGRCLVRRRRGREHGASRLALDSAEARRDAHRFYERESPSYRSLSFGWEL
jgi:hypothetical protein